MSSCSVPSQPRPARPSRPNAPSSPSSPARGKDGLSSQKLQTPRLVTDAYATTPGAPGMLPLPGNALGFATAIAFAASRSHTPLLSVKSVQPPLPHGVPLPLTHSVSRSVHAAAPAREAGVVRSLVLGAMTAVTGALVDRRTVSDRDLELSAPSRTAVSSRTCGPGAMTGRVPEQS